MYCTFSNVHVHVHVHVHVQMYVCMYYTRVCTMYVYDYMYSRVFFICFETWANFAQQWLVCAPLGRHPEPIHKFVNAVSNNTKCTMYNYTCD